MKMFVLLTSYIRGRFQSLFELKKLHSLFVLKNYTCFFVKNYTLFFVLKRKADSFCTFCVNWKSPKT